MKELLHRAQSIEQRYGKLATYLIMAAFLYPRGFSECSMLYKGFFDILLLLAMATILLWVPFDIAYRGSQFHICTFSVVLYYLLLIVITLINLGGISEGLQKLFAVPALCLFCIMQIRRNSKQFLEVLTDILLTVLALNITIFCPPIASNFINRYHINFLGHVQISAQYSLLGMLIAYLQLKLQPAFRLRDLLLFGAAVLNILWTQTAIGYLVLAFFALGFASTRLRKLKQSKKLQTLLFMDSRVYFIAYLLLSVLVLLFALTEIEMALKSTFLSLNGRTIIWREVFQRVLEQPLLGYGAFGVRVYTFWSEQGMNYAHSDFMQHLLDGGIILTVAFYAMLYIFLSCGRSVKSKQIVLFKNICLIALFVLMLTESTTEYFYAHIIFCLLAYLPTIEQHPEYLKEPRNLRSAYYRAFIDQVQ